MVCNGGRGAPLGHDQVRLHNSIIQVQNQVFFSEDTFIDILHFTADNKNTKMTTKLNHKNGDKTLQEDLLSDKQEKIGEFSHDDDHSSLFQKS